MAIPEDVLGRTLRLARRLVLASVLCCTLLAGCVTLPWSKEPKEKPPEGKAVQIATTWENQVMFLPDTEHNGKETPCLAGRLYLFSNDVAEPVSCEGKLVIQLIRTDLVGPDGEPPIIEVWPLKSELLAQMRSKDMIGWGYSLALPWATYHPMLKHLTIAACYTPKDGFPIYSRSKLNFQQTESTFQIHSSVQAPGMMR